MRKWSTTSVEKEKGGKKTTKLAKNSDMSEESYIVISIFSRTHTSIIVYCVCILSYYRLRAVNASTQTTPV